ncbi:signal recognition particle-docking protein FtsY [Limosilactobacillus reuteri]|uniref:Signal recognition particle receptor FtsY n=1 Tax=Limosilactobacillus reuteri TaxID=1598 RepID=A0AAW4X511_LIMRT|nr:signal recognition particle-docking protein FtsY [Limosilactobacillus reuteri]MCC4477506.1 signal recognition particle-docking protein FtsY [Limosilactobacillus reuteri]MCC4479570.1 signal recognition particle-docking protein FtsY [Limosilactobacillus reuteri]MCC4488858.1 signal recognition particle-docking protein FtsY [Limosilactobacillus reuteri]MCC4493507.1 signal recognition particle-docking protein FtsY [Limosilactobacillus reuteri]MCC4495625.1 signal recognition particle-docking prot
MGLFDIFRRHKKKEEEKTPDSSSAVVQSETAREDEAADTTSATPASAPIHPEPVNIPPADSYEEKINPDGTHEILHNRVKEEKEEDTSEKSHSEEVAASSVSEEEVPSSSTPEETISAEEPSSNSAETETAVEPTEPVAEEEKTVEEPVMPTKEEVAEDSSATEESNETDNSEENDGDEEQQPSPEPEEDQESETVKKYDRGLEKSRTGFGARLNKFLANFRHVDEDFFDDLEDMLIESDVGYDMAMKLSDELREEVKLQNAKSKQDVSNVIIEKMVELYDEAGQDENPDLTMAKEGPTVIMFVGVNGAGKTTTIGKMAALFKKQGKKVLLAAADTFRAGATEQLDVWAKRDGVDIVTGPENGDPAAVVFDAVKRAKDENYDILFVDTAGRLQNKVNLMNELAKMKRILTREIPDAPHEVLLVLDATTGQNALNQAKLFKESTDVTGIVLTKLDGTARGGIVLAIRNELHLPVKYVGLGEKVDDLQKFDAGDFVYGLFKGLVEVD